MALKKKPVVMSKKNKPKKNLPLSAEIELQRHKQQLELINRELAQSRSELEAALRQYSDLYDFAPVGYFTLDRDGMILQVNLAGTRLLGVEHEKLIKQNFRSFVTAGSRTFFDVFFEKLLTSSGKEICELELLKVGSEPVWASIDASCFEGGSEARAVVVDISIHKRMASLLRARVRISEFVSLHTFNELLKKMLDEVETITGSQIGFAHFIEPDQKKIKLQMWSTNTLKNMCTAEGLGLHYDVAQAGVWADCVFTRMPVIHNDYSNLVHRKGLPQGHVPILRELVVPVLRNDLIVMIVGVGNKSTNYNDNDVEVVFQLANLAWDIVQGKQADEALRESQELFLLFMRHSPIYAFIKEVTPTESRVIQASNNYEQMVGITGQDMVGRNMAELFPAEFAAKITADDWDVVSNGQVLKLDEDLNGRNYTSIKFPIVQGNKTLLAGYTIDITEQVRAEKALEAANSALQDALIREQQLAHTDPLTNINNRRHLFELAEYEFEIATRYQQPLSVIMFDIDHFKEINDNFGHAVGDQILQSVTQVACAELRSADVIGRYGGEEFVIVLPMTNAQQAYPLAERIRVGVAGIRVPTEKGDAAVTLSIGIVEITHNTPFESVENLIRKADKAMYAAKQAGRNRTEIGEQ